ncbi:MAG: ABC transporter permease [Candidatus Eiseniibacteriota bacterium]
MSARAGTGGDAGTEVPAATGGGSRTGALLDAAGPLAAVVLALLVGAVFIAAVGKNPIDIYGKMLEGVFGNAYGVGQVFFRATPLIFTGLAVALGFRAGLFNIGAEGQLNVGAFVAGLVGAAGAGLPAFVLLPITVLAGMLGGALWALPPAWLKAKVGAHEVINTIMMNFIALALVQYFGHRAFVHATVHTPEIGAGARIPRLDAVLEVFRGSPVNASLLLALVVAVAVGFLLWRTRFGYELRAVGLSPSAAEYAGIRVPRMWMTALCLSGAIAGLVGTNFVQGYKYYYEAGFSGGIGFLGIAVALLGRNHPAGVVVAALFFAALSYGGLVINTEVPKELVEILQAIVILFAIVAHTVVERIRRARA